MRKGGGSNRLLVVAILASIISSVVLGSGCLGVRYVAQAASGQLALMRKARPIAEVIADPSTPDRTRVLLAEVGPIKRFAVDNGLIASKNYETYVELEGPASVWFVSASKRLALEPKTWWFPIVGSFPGLGWFELADGMAFREALESEGWDAYLRGAGAFSTGGWFTDPIVSSMLDDSEDGWGSLVNVVLHELVHVTVLVPNQQFFNESVAAFTADEMTKDYLAARFGLGSAELTRYVEFLANDSARTKVVLEAYALLDEVYKSARTDAEKLAVKREVLTGLDDELQLRRPSNNAFLVGYRTYQLGYDLFAKLFVACNRNWPRYLAALRTLGKGDFPQPLAEDFAPVLAPLIKSRCQASRS